MSSPHAQGRLLAERIARERLFKAPKDHELCACEVIEMEVSGTRMVRFKSGDIARHLGLAAPAEPGRGFGLCRVGELAGAVVMPSSFTRAFVQGRTWPSGSKLYSWRIDLLWFVDGDEVTLSPTRAGLFRMWPFARTVPRLTLKEMEERIAAGSSR